MFNPVLISMVKDGVLKNPFFVWLTPCIVEKVWLKKIVEKVYLKLAPIFKNESINE